VSKATALLMIWTYCGVALIAFWVGLYLAISDGRIDAVKAGVAHWTINAETGERKFEWIKCTEDCHE
jgi:hypothetical protein